MYNANDRRKHFSFTPWPWAYFTNGFNVAALIVTPILIRYCLYTVKCIIKSSAILKCKWNYQSLVVLFNIVIKTIVSTTGSNI